jgi:hypothetical protein
MPELVADQDSFTVYFDDTLDLVDESGSYLSRWENLVSDYQKRIELYPALKEEFEIQQKLKTINNTHLIWLQRYIDSINYVFDIQFSSLKTMLMSGVWKLGLGIHGYDDQFLYFVIHRIPYGDITPPLMHLTISQSEKMGFPSLNNVISRKGISVSNVIDKRSPVEEGMGVALEVVQNAIENYTYHIFGETVCSEILFDFLDDYSLSFGLPYADVYHIKDLATGFYRYFPIWCYLVEKHENLNSSSSIIDFDVLSHNIKEKDLSDIDKQVQDILISGKSTPTVFISSKKYKFKLLEDAIQYLTSKKMVKVTRPYPILGNFIKGRITKGEIYDEVSLRSKIVTILENSVYEYEEFLEGNKIKYQVQSITNPNLAIIYGYQVKTDGWGDFIEVIYYRCVVENLEKRFPKVSFSNGEVLRKPKDEVSDSNDTYFHISVDGIDMKAIKVAHSGFLELDDRTPMLSYIYSLLWDDMESNFGLGKHFIPHPNMETIPLSL